MESFLEKASSLLPLLFLISQFVKTPGSSPFSFSLTFGIHAMLTSILETDSIFNEVLDVYGLIKHSIK